MAGARVLRHFRNCTTVLTLRVNMNWTFLFFLTRIIGLKTVFNSALDKMWTPLRQFWMNFVHASLYNFSLMPSAGGFFKVVNKCEAPQWSSHIPLTPFFSHHFPSSSPLSISSISQEVNIEGNKLWSSANLQAGRKMREREGERRKDSKTCRQTERKKGGEGETRRQMFPRNHPTNFTQTFSSLRKWNAD